MKRQLSKLSASAGRLFVLVFAAGVALISNEVGFAAASASASYSLDVKVFPRFAGAPLVFDSITNLLDSTQSISVTRLDFLLSEIALRNSDGGWISETSTVAYVSAREGRTHFQLGGIPAGNYDRFRFHVGLKPGLNHQDPAKAPAGNPLNPDVNGLHWGWMGGYVFLALEGNRVEPRGKLSGYSYHLATDRQLMTVELPVKLDLRSNSELLVALNVDRIFAGPNRFNFSETTSSTHSRTNDVLAALLRQNVERAFTFAGSSSVPTTETNAPVAGRLEIAANARPYRLTFPAFFPRPSLPNDNPLTEEGVALGRKLFFDPQLSCNGQQSCASCHNPARGFCEQSAVSTGAEGKPGTRNAMPLFNLAWKSSFFWDGRAPSLRGQVLQPIQNPIEMHESLSNVVIKLVRSTNGYPALFARALGTTEITPDRVARALEQFLLTEISQSSKFDRFLKGQAQFTPVEQRGFELFHTEYDPRREQFGADCFHCHGGPLFHSQAFANNGLDAQPKDLGRSLVTKKSGDDGKFAVPSLRNIEVTAPYMHDGRFNTLEEVVEHYSGGVNRSATLDPNLAKHPDGGVPLSAADKRALVAFLKTLTDERFVSSKELANVP